ncbi:MAG TPA: hypothetical protein VNB64_11170 [Solirubrobacteraceae bacterium]|nr:hypothetical protein [Solirubrobacteraceae bacterium]
MSEWILDILDSLDHLMHHAKPMPLGDAARVEPDVVERLARELRQEVDRAIGSPPALRMHELEELGARTVFAQGEAACVERLVSLSRAARAGAGQDTPDGQARELLDRLDALVADAKPVPLSSEVRLDREAVYEILDGVRIVVPDLGASAPEELDESAARLLYHQGEGPVVERLVRLSRAAAAAQDA